jgi:NTP pyrophosphatase (non-canonical NTP hydrolase)
MTESKTERLELSEEETKEYIRLSNRVARSAHLNSRNKGFWEAPKCIDANCNVEQPRNKGEMLALIHSEISEALEAVRKNVNAPDKHCPEYTGLAIELADAIIRIYDFAAGFGLPVNEALVAKMAFNVTRPHKHGKKF